MLADIMTKPLGKIEFTNHRNNLVKVRDHAKISIVQNKKSHD